MAINYLFTKSNGAQLTPDSIFYTLKEKVRKLGISNFTPTSVALQGIVTLIEKGLTMGEIRVLTGFETQKIEDVSKYLNDYIQCSASPFYGTWSLILLAYH